MKPSDLSDKIADLSLVELHSLVEELRLLTRSKSQAAVEDYLAIAKKSFESLPHSAHAEWSSGRVMPDGFIFTWKFFGKTIFEISSSPPFSRFIVVWHPTGQNVVFNSFTEAIDDLIDLSEDLQIPAKS